MKKTIIYLIAIAALSAIVYFFVLKDNQSFFQNKEANFTCKDTASISTIFLSNVDGKSIVLKKINNKWTLNDTLTPRSDAISNLLQVLYMQQAAQPVTLNYHDEVVKDMSTNHTKVELYKGDKKTHSFIVSRYAGPNQETYMLCDGAQRPYTVVIPGENRFVGILYFTDLDSWISRKLFENTGEITKIEVSYKDSVQYNFNCILQNGNYTITGGKTIDLPLNTKRVNSYLKFFGEIYCLGFENEYEYKDSVLKRGRQLGTLILHKKNETPESITVYYKPPRQGTKGIIKIGNEQYDFDSFFALYNQKQFLIISRTMVEKMFRTYYEFYQKDE